MAKNRAKRAMPTWTKGDKTTKSGGGKVIKKSPPKKKSSRPFPFTKKDVLVPNFGKKKK